MQRYSSIASAFAFGYFFTLGILTIGWAVFHEPKSFGIATALAAVGAVFAALARFTRLRGAHRG